MVITIKLVCFCRPGSDLTGNALHSDSHHTSCVIELILWQLYCIARCKNQQSELLLSFYCYVFVFLICIVNACAWLKHQICFSQLYYSSLGKEPQQDVLTSLYVPTSVKEIRCKPLLHVYVTNEMCHQCDKMTSYWVISMSGVRRFGTFP